jgi:hypothetical protein
MDFTPLSISFEEDQPTADAAISFLISVVQ